MGIGDILVFLVVLGVIIFFHELGHFIAAKACNVYCDRFSLGMPPRLFGLRVGETDYCVGALPIGGYVKMAGQEDAPKGEEEQVREYAHVPRERWFNNRPPWQRFVIVFSGPSMNFVLGILLYGIVAAVGANVDEMKVDNRVGKIEPNSPAASAPMYAFTTTPPDISYDHGPDAVGWQTGDRVMSINGRRVTNINDVATEAILGKGRVLEVCVDRTRPDGTVTHYFSRVEPRVMEEEEHARFGVAPFVTALIGAVHQGMPAQQAGLQKGDIILRVDNTPVDQQTFRERVEKADEGTSLSLAIERDGKAIRLSVPVQIIGRFKGITFRLPEDTSPGDEVGSHAASGEVKGLEILDIDSAAAEETGLQRKDVVLELDGRPATPALLEEIERTQAGHGIPAKVRRPGLLFGLGQKEEILTRKLPLAPVGVIGVTWGEKMVFYRVPAAQVLPESFRLAYQDVYRTIMTLVRLVTGDVSARDLGGPVLIGQLVIATAHLGYAWLFQMMAFISISLFIVNLLPLPLLDGGLIILLGVEAVRRRPLDRKILERIQQVGLALIVGLMLFVTYNDIARLISSYLP